MEASDNGLEVDECHCIMEAHHFSKRGFGKTTVLCSNISFGKEPVPISCVVDEESLLIQEKPWESFTYVTKSMPNMKKQDCVSLTFVFICPMPQVQHWCGCRGLVCSPLTCDHVYIFGNDFEEARDVYRKSMRCRFPYDDKERIILEVNFKSLVNVTQLHVICFNLVFPSLAARLILLHSKLLWKAWSLFLLISVYTPVQM